MSVTLDIPYNTPDVLEHLHETHARFDITPNGDTSLSFEVVLPRTWAHSTKFGPVVDGVLRERGLCIFTASLEHASPIVTVTVTTVPFEIPADAWVQHMLERDGWQVVAGRWVPGSHGLYYDASGVMSKDGGEFTRRTSARVDGARIICVHCVCAREHWDTIKGTFWIAHESFSLLAGSGSSQMEPWVQVQTSSPVFETVHPYSWTSESAVITGTTDISGVHIRLADQEQDKLYAYIVARARRCVAEEPSLIEWLDDTMLMLERSGLRQSEGLRRLTDQEDPRSIGIEGWRGGYLGDGTLQSAELTFRIGMIVRENLLITIVAYGPKPTDDMLLALRTQRAFEIVRGGLRVIE